MIGHRLRGQLEHFHATGDEVAACEWEWAEQYRRLDLYAHDDQAA